ncbi:hypothetical protein BJV77DRAFT_556770 [Russula vinacea]|nr:hypothetical protein BJV77DRAFT_556770 [Russula vinacea]
MMMMVMMMSTAGSCGSCHHGPPRIKQVPGFEGRRTGAQHSVYGFTKERRYRCGARTRTGALRAKPRFLQVSLAHVLCGPTHASITCPTIPNLRRAHQNRRTSPPHPGATTAAAARPAVQRQIPSSPRAIRKCHRRAHRAARAVQRATEKEQRLQAEINMLLDAALAASPQLQSAATSTPIPAATATQSTTTTTTPTPVHAHLSPLEPHAAPVAPVVIPPAAPHMNGHSSSSVAPPPHVHAHPHAHLHGHAYGANHTPPAPGSLLRGQLTRLFSEKSDGGGGTTTYNGAEYYASPAGLASADTPVPGHLSSPLSQSWIRAWLSLFCNVSCYEMRQISFPTFHFLAVLKKKINESRGGIPNNIIHRDL